MNTADSVDSPPSNPPPALVKALRQALRPLLHVMLARGITLPYLAELIKSLLVEVAERDFQLDGKPVTDSRISLLSGVHRKDVNRLRRGKYGADGADAGAMANRNNKAARSTIRMAATIMFMRAQARRRTRRHTKI